MKKRILHIDYDDLKNPYAAGGQAYTTRELMKRLAQTYEITVVTGKYPGAKNEYIEGISYVRLGIGTKGFSVSLLSHWLLIPWYVLLAQKNYDIIFECFTGPFTVSFIPFFAKKPLIGLPMFFDSKRLGEKYHLPLDIFQKTLIKKYKKFIVLTENLGERVKALNQKAMYSIIAGGVSDELLASTIKTGEYALYIGRIDIYNKGLKLLLEAWKTINEKLIIAGNGNDEEAIKKMINDFGLENKVKFVGKITGKTKTELYSRAHFVIQPSRFETFGYVALETLASGKLLVCFDIPGFDWIPEKSAIKVKTIDVKELEQGIKKAIDSVMLLKEVRVVNRAFAKQFTWDNIAKQYEIELQKYL